MRQFFILAVSMLALSSCNSKSNSSDDNSKSIDKLNKLLNNEILTKERIENESDSALEELIFSNLYVNIKVDIKSTDEDYKNQFNKFTVPQQIFYSTLTLERNVKQFGFRGYFEHKQSVGQFAVDALNGYKELGLLEISNTVNKAIDINRSDSKLSDSSFHKLDTILLRQIVEQNSSKERLKLIRNNINSFITKK